MKAGGVHLCFPILRVEEDLEWLAGRRNSHGKQLELRPRKPKTNGRAVTRFRDRRHIPFRLLAVKVSSERVRSLEL